MKLIRSLLLGLGIAGALSLAIAQTQLENNSAFTGHVRSTGAPPVLSACGTTPTLGAGATDLAGTITTGTTSTGCVLTFAVAYTIAPTCIVQWIATPLASQSYVTSTTALTITQTSASNNVIKYICIAISGG